MKVQRQIISRRLSERLYVLNISCHILLGYLCALFQYEMLYFQGAAVVLVDVPCSRMKLNAKRGNGFFMGSEDRQTKSG